MGTCNGYLLIPLTALQDLSYVVTEMLLIRPCKASHWVVLIHPHPTLSICIYVHIEHTGSKQTVSTNTLLLQWWIFVYIRFVSSCLPFILYSTLPSYHLSHPVYYGTAFSLSSCGFTPFTATPCSCTNSSWVLLCDPSLSDH